MINSHSRYRAGRRMRHTLMEWPVEYIGSNAKHRFTTSEGGASKQDPAKGQCWSGGKDGIQLNMPFSSIICNATESEAVVQVFDRPFAMPAKSMFLLCDLVQVLECALSLLPLHLFPTFGCFCYACLYFQKLLSIGCAQRCSAKRRVCKRVCGGTESVGIVRADRGRPSLAKPEHQTGQTVPRDDHGLLFVSSQRRCHCAEHAGHGHRVRRRTWSVFCVYVAARSVVSGVQQQQSPDHLSQELCSWFGARTTRGCMRSRNAVS